MVFNLEAIILESGEYGIETLGDGKERMFVHQIFCLEDGTISITPLRGATFTYEARRGETINVVPRKVQVSSGKFVGFKGYLLRKYF